MTPVSSDGGSPFLRQEAGGGGDVIGDFSAFILQAGSGGAQQGAAGDTDDGLDEGMPVGRGQGIASGKYFDAAVLLAGSAGVARSRDVGRRAVDDDGADGIKQVGLVRLQLDQKMVAGVAGDLECFFDNAWRPG